jgi:hypothetical protein
MLIRPAIGDTDPIRYRHPTPDDQFSGNILDEAMRSCAGARICKELPRLWWVGAGSALGADWGVKGRADLHLSRSIAF